MILFHPWKLIDLFSSCPNATDYLTSGMYSFFSVLLLDQVGWQSFTGLEKAQNTYWSCLAQVFINTML